MTPRGLRFFLGLLLLSVFPAAWLIQKYLGSSGLSVCLFRTVTGKPCPFCGLTRALAGAAQGEFQAAFGYHPFWWLAAALIAGGGLLAMADGLTGADLSGRVRPMAAFGHRYLLILFVVFGLYRIFV